MSDGLGVTPVITITAAVRRASSRCCGGLLKKLPDAEDGTLRWQCKVCGNQCDKVMSGPENIQLASNERLR